MKNKIDNKGFTLIEFIVATAIFVIVISVVISLFTTSLMGHRRVMAIQNVQENSLFLLEFIAKEIRMSDIKDATLYTLNIARPDGESVTYSFTGGTITRTDSSSSGPINSGEVSVSGRFYTSGIGSNDDQQPRVTIVMKVETTGKAEEKAKINIQASLSPRNLEL